VVVVIGAGIIGLGTVALLKAMGVRKIIMASRSEKRLTAARMLGADLALTPREEDIVQRVKSETGGLGADVVVETAGKPVTYIQSVEMLRKGGKLMLVGIHEGPVQFNPNRLILKAIQVKGCIDAHFSESAEAMKDGILRANQVVTHTFPLDRITKAFETALDTSESIRVMVEP